MNNLDDFNTDFGGGKKRSAKKKAVLHMRQRRQSISPKMSAITVRKTLLRCQKTAAKTAQHSRMGAARQEAAEMLLIEINPAARQTVRRTRGQTK